MGGCFGTEDLKPECGKENLNPETSRLEKSRPEVNRAETEKNSIGKYKVLRLLGEGGEGSVYLARDEDLQRMAAVKHLGKSRREAEWLQKLEHPMLPVIYELLWDESWYLVMEYIRGITLRRYIDENGYACEEQVCTWIEQLLDVTEYLHTMKPPVIYRDFKPDNIIVCPDGHIRLVDFGAAVLRNYGFLAVGFDVRYPLLHGAVVTQIYLQRLLLGTLGGIGPVTFGRFLDTIHIGVLPPAYPYLFEIVSVVMVVKGVDCEYLLFLYRCQTEYGGNVIVSVLEFGLVK